MRNSKMLRLGLFVMLAAVMVLTSSVSATGSASEVSRVVYFTIQNNNLCKADDTFRTSLHLNVNNVGASNAILSVHLYNDAGTEITHSGLNNNNGGYMDSTFAPGTQFTLNSKNTAHYMINFSGGSLNFPSCSDRPAYGKIVVYNDSGLLMANGENRGIEITVPVKIHTDTPVIINGGNPF